MTVAEFSDSLHVDVAIVGAGVSGIGLAHHLSNKHPSKSYVILEARDSIGGTWDLFRYPGIRSDSDLHTFGYDFKPWVNDKAIAGGAEILAYIREAAAEAGSDRKVLLRHKVISADWLSAEACWNVQVERTDTKQRRIIRAKWLFSAAGYYSYSSGYSPHFQGIERFKGQVIHPQHWPSQLNYSGKRVVVIGSGATAVTLVPAMAKSAGHVTMLQRTPTYILSIPAKDTLANLLRAILPHEWAYSFTRRKNILIGRTIWRLCLRYPQAARLVIRYLNKRKLPKGFDVDKHFNPPYNPWEQRMCMVPDGDLFKVIKSGQASVVTDRIKTLESEGLLLESGQMLKADIIVTATGLNIQLFGGLRMTVDGEKLDFSQRVAYKGMMLDGVPNFAFAVGYTNASYTLKTGLISEHFCRILARMDSEPANEICTPELPKAKMALRPLFDLEAGYVQRSVEGLPRQGNIAPWTMQMDYDEDVEVLRKGAVDDPCLHFTRRELRPARNAAS